MRATLPITALLATLVFASQAHAQVPQRVPIQGTLYDAATGDPIDGTLPVDFTLYADPSGSVSVWSDTINVTFIGGTFTAYLGSGDPVDPMIFFEHTQVFVGIAVDGDAEMELVALATAPYAAMAAFAAEADTVDGLDASGIVDAAVTAARTLFALQGHRHSWTDLDGIPAGFADGVDNSLTESEVDAMVSNNGFLTSGSTVAWSNLSGVPPGFADGTDDRLSEAEVDSMVSNNGYLTSGSAVAWGNLTGVPGGFADGVDNDTTLNESQVDAMVSNNGYATSGRGVELYNCTRYPSSGYLNNMDAVLDATCPAGQVLNGLYSYHSNSTEDRQWAYYCCSLRLQ